MRRIICLGTFFAFIFCGHGQEISNVALKGFAAQISQWLPAGVFPAPYAIDGRLETFTHTSGGEPESFWSLNLGGVQAIHAVEIHGRADCCGDRLLDFTVLILGPDGRTEKHVEYYGSLAPAPPDFLNLTFDTPVVGQYVKIKKGPAGPAGSTLSLGEVRVFSSGQQATAEGVVPGSIVDPTKWLVLQVTDNGVTDRMETAASSLNSATGKRVESTASTLNFFGQGTNHGNFTTGESTFITANSSAAGALVENLVLGAKAHFLVPANQGDDYSFSVWADDSFQLYVDGKVVCWTDGTNANNVVVPVENNPYPGQGQSLNVYTNYSAPNIVGQIHLEPGVHSIELIYFQSTLFSHVELSAAKGNKTAFDSSFKLVGDNAGGGLELVAAVPPTIISQPEPAEAPFGGEALFTVGAAGSSALTYQWFFNGEPLSRATSSNLFVRNAGESNKGDYFVIVKNGAGEVQSVTVALNVTGSSNDSDGDLLPDEWEQQYFFDLTQDGTGDYDSDGVTNSREHGADTSPSDPNHKPTILSIAAVPEGVQIRWMGGIMARQVLQRTDRLALDAEWIDITTLEPPTNAENLYTDTPPEKKIYFYRVRYQRL